MKTFKTLRRRSLALILALTMCLSMVQTTALAVDEMTNDPGHSFEVTDVYEETSTDSSKGTGTDSKDLTVTNSPSEEYPVVGEEFSYTITVKNPKEALNKSLRTSSRHTFPLAATEYARQRERVEVIP